MIRSKDPKSYNTCKDDRYNDLQKSRGGSRSKQYTYLDDGSPNFAEQMRSEDLPSLFFRRKCGIVSKETTTLCLRDLKGEALIDRADFDLLFRFHWRLKICRKRGLFYAEADINGKSVSMHRFLLGLTDGNTEGDHINGDGLDNRRCNLRPASASQNRHNSRKRTFKAGTVRYKGVSRSGTNFRAYIRDNGKLRYLGSFTEAKTAALAYDEAARELFGEFACCNFPKEAA